MIFENTFLDQIINAKRDRRILSSPKKLLVIGDLRALRDDTVQDNVQSCTAFH